MSLAGPKQGTRPGIDACVIIMDANFMHINSKQPKSLSKFPRKEGTIRMSPCTCSTRTSILANSTACNWEDVNHVIP